MLLQPPFRGGSAAPRRMKHRNIQVEVPVHRLQPPHCTPKHAPARGRPPQDREHPACSPCHCPHSLGYSLAQPRVPPCSGCSVMARWGTGPVLWCSHGLMGTMQACTVLQGKAQGLHQGVAHAPQWERHSAGLRGQALCMHTTALNHRDEHRVCTQQHRTAGMSTMHTCSSGAVLWGEHCACMQQQCRARSPAGPMQQQLQGCWEGQ